MVFNKRNNRISTSAQPQRTARYYYLRFLRLRGDPRTLARGIAAGLFVGMTPTIPFHSILSLFIAYIINGNTIASLIAATLISTPFTLPLQYYITWKAGNWLTDGNLSWEKIKNIINHLMSDASFMDKANMLAEVSGEAVAIMLAGGLLLAVPVSLTGYIVSFYFFRKIRDKRREKHILK